ncbi:MAG: calcium/sodium antiporter [Salinivirgaceae bacterium]|nr:calcium/sodium antiporter [Salinivirgaceae bacterium]
MGVSIFFIVIGLILLVKGADFFVNGASSLAKRYNISELAIGLTVVAFGTSAPEMIVNVVASVQNHQEIVFGNIIGSNNFNLFIILGITGLITPLVVQSQTAWKEIPFSFLAIVVLYFLVNDQLLGIVPANMLSRIDGLVLLFFFGGFIYYIYRQLKIDKTTPVVTSKSMSNFKLWASISGGLLGLIIGGKLVVNYAVSLAQILHISEKIIGLTIVAVGTSLPELSTSVVAALKKNSDIAIGNIIGSNIFNILLVLSASSLARPISYNTTFNTDIYLLAGGTILLYLFMFSGGRKKLDRWEAGILFLIYLIYIWLVIIDKI